MANLHILTMQYHVTELVAIEFALALLPPFHCPSIFLQDLSLFLHSDINWHFFVFQQAGDPTGFNIGLAPEAPETDRQRKNST